MHKMRRVLPVDYSCMPDGGVTEDLEISIIDDLKAISPSSYRAARRVAQENRDGITTARDLLLSSLLSISAVPVSAFSEDEQKTVIVTLKEITERIRGLRKRLS